jgi:hypothetical protein
MEYRPIFHRLSLFLAALLLTVLFFSIRGIPLPGGADRSEAISEDSGEILRGNATGEFQGSGGIGSSDLEREMIVEEPWADPESIIRAFARAYPESVEEVAMRNGDWALRIDDMWFHFADGKMLREDSLDEAEFYSGYSFYPYRPELPELPEYTEQEIAELEARVESQATSGIGRHMGLIDALWGIDDFGSSDQSVKTIYLFRRQVNVHRSLLEDLAEVEARIYRLAESDAELRSYIENIGTITGHNWRQISGTSSRSLHSYGIAVDILPARYSSAQVYWRWARQLGLPWYILPYEQRLMPPEAFIREFEKAGFVWGGKWRRFDTIHFEYRPEIFEINRRYWEIEAPAP